MMRHRSLLVVLGLVCLFISRVCSVAAEEVQVKAPARVNVNLGSIASIEVPALWHQESSGQSECRSFLKTRSSWSDCLIKVQIKGPVKISQDLAKALQNSLNSKEVTQAQISDLKKLTDFGTTYGDNGKLSGTVRSINGQQILLLEQVGKFTGPCESIGAGRTRRPLLSYARGTAYVLTGADTVQTINFDSDVMGEVAPCRKQIEAALNSINWRHISSYSRRSSGAVRDAALKFFLIET